MYISIDREAKTEKISEIVELVPAQRLVLVISPS